MMVNQTSQRPFSQRQLRVGELVLTKSRTTFSKK